MQSAQAIIDAATKEAMSTIEEAERNKDSEVEKTMLNKYVLRLWC